MLSLADKLLNWAARLSREKEEKFSFELEGRVFSKVSLFRKKSSGVLSKAGRLSWFALMDGEPVKIYECHSELQAVFIEKVSNLPMLRAYFPACLVRIGAYLVVRWVKGNPVTWHRALRDQDVLYRMAKMQAVIHGHKIEGRMASSTFDYISYLRNRLQYYKGILPIDDALKRIDSSLHEASLTTTEHISHPDFTARNVIIEESSGDVKIIDNELLTQNQYYLFDLFNTHYSLDGILRNKILERYLIHYTASGGDLTDLVENERFFTALWYLRLIGSLLQGGPIGKAVKLSRHYAKGDVEPHPLVRLANERFVR